MAVTLTVENLMSGQVGLPKPGEADPRFRSTKMSTVPQNSMRSQLACATKCVASLMGKRLT